MLYFAYGSNLDKDQMARRCQSAAFLNVASLKGYRLAFTRHSNSWDCAVASVLEDENSEVWGVIYEISEEDCKKLDEFEDYQPDRIETKNSYNREIIEVFEKGDPNKPRKAAIYIAVKQKHPGSPSSGYLRLIRDAALFLDFPYSYIQMLWHLKSGASGYHRSYNPETYDRWRDL
jgi:gamma-glutamylcyclotransferase (GGCT)/AIG2-like uncharacterized protein YtfP